MSTVHPSRNRGGHGCAQGKLGAGERGHGDSRRAQKCVPLVPASLPVATARHTVPTTAARLCAAPPATNLAMCGDHLHPKWVLTVPPTLCKEIRAQLSTEIGAGDEETTVRRRSSELLLKLSSSNYGFTTKTILSGWWKRKKTRAFQAIMCEREGRRRM